MRTLVCLVAVLVLAGCRSSSEHAAQGIAGTNATLTITPGGPLRGQIATIHPGARFVVLRFPVGPLPSPHRKLGVYREGTRVGELRVTGPHRDNSTVADIVAGDCRVGDEAREE